MFLGKSSNEAILSISDGYTAFSFGGYHIIENYNELPLIVLVWYSEAYESIGNS